MQNQSNLWELVARHLSNEATEDENNHLKQRMEEDPCLQFSLDVLKNFWETVKDENPEVAKNSLNMHIRRLQKRNNNTTP